MRVTAANTGFPSCTCQRYAVIDLSISRKTANRAGCCETSLRKRCFDAVHPQILRNRPVPCWRSNYKLNFQSCLRFTHVALLATGKRIYRCDLKSFSKKSTRHRPKTRLGFGLTYSRIGARTIAAASDDDHKRCYGSRSFPQWGRSSEKHRGTFYLLDFFGLPRGRRDYSRASCLAVVVCQRVSSNEVPRASLWRSDLSSTPRISFTIAAKSSSLWNTLLRPLPLFRTWETKPPREALDIRAIPAP